LIKVRGMEGHLGFSQRDLALFCHKFKLFNINVD